RHDRLSRRHQRQPRLRRPRGLPHVPGIQRHAPAPIVVLDAELPPQPTLATERLVLRPLVDADALAIADGAGDKRVARYLIQVPSPYPIALARRWLRHRYEWWELGRGITLAIATRELPDELLGSVSLRRYARDRRAELGYWLAHSAWGHGYATEAC